MNINSVEDFARDRGRPEKFLLIDDDPATRDMFQYFTKHHNVVWTLVDSGEAGLQCVKESNYRLVMLDLQLVGDLGEEVFRRIKAFKPRQGVAVISGHLTENSIRGITQHGFSIFIEKPTCFTHDFFDQMLAVLGVKKLGTDYSLPPLNAARELSLA